MYTLPLIHFRDGKLLGTRYGKGQKNMHNNQKEQSVIYEHLLTCEYYNYIIDLMLIIMLIILFKEAYMNQNTYTIPKLLFKGIQRTTAVIKSFRKNPLVNAYITQKPVN